MLKTKKSKLTMAMCVTMCLATMLSSNVFAGSDSKSFSVDGRTAGAYLTVGSSYATVRTTYPIMAGVSSEVAYTYSINGGTETRISYASNANASTSVSATAYMNTSYQSRRSQYADGTHSVSYGSASNSATTNCNY